MRSFVISSFLPLWTQKFTKNLASLRVHGGPIWLRCENGTSPCGVPWLLRGWHLLCHKSYFGACNTEAGHTRRQETRPGVDPQTRAADRGCARRWMIVRTFAAQSQMTRRFACRVRPEGEEWRATAPPTGTWTAFSLRPQPSGLLEPVWHARTPHPKRYRLHDCCCPFGALFVESNADKLTSPLERFGVCELHRKSFRGVKEYLEETGCRGSWIQGVRGNRIK